MGDPRGAVVGFDEFVHQDASDEIKKKLGSNRWPAILGSKPFIGRIRETFNKTKHPDPELTQVRPLIQWTPPRRVLRLLMREFQVSLHHLLRNNKRKNEARNAAIYFLRMACQLSYPAIGRWVGGMGKSQLSRLCRREKPIPKKWDRIAAQLGLKGQGDV